VTDAGPVEPVGPALVWPDGVVVRPQEPLARHSPWRVGGPCDLWVVIHARAALDAALAALRETGLKRTIVGAGTRTVFRDGGLAGAVVRLGQEFLAVEDDGDGVWVGAAAPLGLAAAAVGEGLAHLRTAPGTLGASLALDDGWDGFVDRVRCVQRVGEKEVAWADVARSSVLFTAARLKKAGEGRPGPVLPGGWFAPLDDDAPASLLRDAALAATRLRRVALPASEPDRLVNLGGGTAKDLQLLQRSAIERVHTARGVQLQDRMTWLGRP
jgi:UDP-N-acetylenolpyruvoylglucosamine reductase